jgi:hypothetical protein
MVENRIVPAVFAPRIAAGDGFYDTATLAEVIRAPENAPQLNSFWLQFFPRVILSETEKIMFDEIDENEYRLAPFVAPNVQGRPVRAKGFVTRSFRPAYVKPKHVVDPTRSITRRAGEALLGGVSRIDRYNAIIADNLRRERRMIENRWEWMACQAIVTGQVVISGEDYPEVTVDFNRDSDLTIVNSGATLWTASTATPIADIQAARLLAFQLSRAPVNTLIFGLDAWAAFLQTNHPDVQALLNMLIRGNESLFNASNLNSGEPFAYQGALVGTGGIGRLEMYTYSNFYEGDADGVGVPYLDPGTVVGVGGGIQGARCFGAIMDRAAQLQVTDMFPKMWDEEDPSVTFTMTQSAPLMVPLRPNNSFSIKVTA